MTFSFWPPFIGGDRGDEKLMTAAYGGVEERNYCRWGQFGDRSGMNGFRSTYFSNCSDSVVFQIDSDEVKFDLGVR